ncbi:MAG: hypothetical protein AB7O65_11770 [Candidatus Korobacteraceae bacterium]
MKRIGKIIHGYVFWTYERGSFHYDVMVTLILAFIFFGPYLIDFKDAPVQQVPHQIGVVVHPDGSSGFYYEIDVAAVQGTDDPSIRQDLLRVIEPIAGEVEIAGYDVVRDSQGSITVYRVHVLR